VLLTTKSGPTISTARYSNLAKHISGRQELFRNFRGKIQPESVWRVCWRTIRKNKTFFFLDGEQKFQRRGIQFTGLVPSLAMRDGDYSADPFGNPASGLVIRKSEYGRNVHGPSVFHQYLFPCDPNRNPLPANANGSQPQGTACNKIPSGLINPIGQAMMKLYPPPNATGQLQF